MEAGQCIFCKIAKGEIPSYKVYEDEKVLAFLDINPIAQGHTLIIPKKHAEKIYELSDEELNAFFAAVAKIAPSIEKAANTNALNYLINQGREAGQIIPHFHMHITPRREKDGVEMRVPRNRKLSEKEFKEMVEKIARGL